MTVTVFACDGAALPSACTVTVPKQGRCRDLIQALSNACSLKHNERLVLVEVCTKLVHKLNICIGIIACTYSNSVCYIDVLFTDTKPFDP